MTKNRPTILIPIMRGHMARLLIYSGVIKQLCDLGASIILVTNAQTLEPLALHFKNLPIEVIKAPTARLSIYYRWYKVYNYLFETFLPTESSKEKLAWFAAHEPIRHKILTTLHPWVLRRIRQLWLVLRRTVLPASLYKEVFSEREIDIVVVGSAARNPEEYYMLRYAIEHNIRNICTLQSWDLLTTKGDLLERPDRLTVWNDANKYEAIQLFNYDSDDVLVVGAPQFDLYFTKETYLSREEWCAKYNLDPNKKIILVTGGTGNVHHNLPDVLRALISGITNDEYVCPIQVLVRPHPAVYLSTVAGDGTEADLQMYESWHIDIKCDRPKQSKFSIIADTNEDEHRVLANNLYHADVLVDFYGTVSVEAALVNTPVIYANVQSNFQDDVNDIEQVIDRNNYTHLKHIIETNGVRLVKTRAQLYNAINMYLDDPLLDSDARREIAASFGYTNVGYSVNRMARAIYDYGCGIWPPSED